MKTFIGIFIILFFFQQGKTQNIRSLQTASDKAQKVMNSTGGDLVKSPLNYVNPFVGTGGHGHTFPGATAPFE